MGMINADIELANPRKPDLQPLAVQALVHTGVMTICIPEHVAVQLQLEQIETPRSLRRMNGRTWCRMSAPFR